MPTLDWIGKQAVVNHHRQVPFRLLKCDDKLSVGDPNSGNLLIQGDNLEALKALLPYYAGQVKCIYIDPPYNTGNEGWIYNDNVNSPEMRSWLGRVVGDDAEDLSRHDKWLCMMYPRISLLREFLSDEGAIFVSIDDNEIQNLRGLLDEVFGARNFIASVIWQKRTSPDARLSLGPAHDYVVVYAKSKPKVRFRKLTISSDRRSAYRNHDNDPRGDWASVDLTGQTGHATPDQFYEIVTPARTRQKPPPGRCWALAETTFLRLRTEGRIWFGKKGNSRPRLKKYLIESEGTTAWTWWPHEEAGSNQEATKELNDILGRSDIFDNPKPTRLLERIFQLATDGEALVLDSFAGSGTTGQAILSLNRIDGGRRRFILVEIEKRIAEEVTFRRISHVIEGRRSGKVDSKLALPGGFRFCTLGRPLFDEQGNIADHVRFTDLAAHVFFTETGVPLPKMSRSKSPMLGVHQDKAVYLLFNGIIGDKRPEGGNVLTNEILRLLPPHDGPRVIYGESCRLSRQRLRREGIVFKQIPYEIKVD